VNVLILLYKECLQWLLSFSIILFIAASFFFFTLLLISRCNKIVQQKSEARLSALLDNVLFSILFVDKPIHKLLESKNYQTFFKKKRHRKKLLHSIIKLHANYSGIYNLRLEEFYRKSGLINVSFGKLRSNSWPLKCEGIRELSQMHIKEAFSDIHKCIWHKENTLRLEGLLGLIRLEGLEGLTVLIDYAHPINDWIQLNVLYEIDNSNLTTVKDFSNFLTSENESVVLLGLRLIAKFNQIQNIDQIRKIQKSNASSKVKQQAERALEMLPAAALYTSNR